MFIILLKGPTFGHDDYSLLWDKCACWYENCGSYFGDEGLSTKNVVGMRNYGSSEVLVFVFDSGSSEVWFFERI